MQPKKKPMPPKRKPMKAKAKEMRRGMTVQPDGSKKMSPPADRRGAVVPVKQSMKKKNKLGGHSGY